MNAATSDGKLVYVDQGIPDRHALRPKNRASVSPPRNIYICIEGSQALCNHLSVRDLCRSDPEVRQAYAEAKRELSRQEWDSVDEYCKAKDEVISWILLKAGFSEEEVQQIADLQ